MRSWREDAGSSGSPDRACGTAEENGNYAVQAKGGNWGLVVRDNRFGHPGARGVNIGGRTCGGLGTREDDVPLTKQAAT